MLRTSKRFIRFVCAPQNIEVAAIFVLFGVLAASIIMIMRIPPPNLNREAVLRVLEVTFGALGFATLLLLWAQLRHGSTLNKRIAYHEHFHDLPTGNKVEALYGLLHRLQIPRPTANEPLSEESTKKIVDDVTPAPATGHIVVREYLNDFEEFAAAVNCGLIDVHYAYHLEGPRTVNAYFGFHRFIEHLIKTDNDAPGGLQLGDTEYYKELSKRAIDWKERMADASEKALARRKKQDLKLQKQDLKSRQKRKRGGVDEVM